MARRRGDTREQIREVALKLFAEQGYEKTSLREIAERLGVTKAALYYHFKTKEDIVTSLFDDFKTEVDELFAWAREQSVTPEMRREFIRRYAEIIQGTGGTLMRFMQENGPAVRHLKAGDDMRKRFQALADVLVDKDASLPDQIRARLSIFSLHMTLFIRDAIDADDEAVQAAALEVALDLLPTG
ncbi:TetR family transcriptional regulator [Actinomadura rubrobrunea]|uniref:TetR family transcriptional regulator n=1 Tax=Actinomadura rubrobrunea TaxID=115335 RepID=A0A9W6UWX0_9ACTN|nr:TetR/AcrR family transcriptional regulator [Actinomadura rubrobrunea]GLW67111.1 TetR family transcriptional regulator [Actinomadura rubrobrunea]